MAFFLNLIRAQVNTGASPLDTIQNPPTAPQAQFVLAAEYDAKGDYTKAVQWYLKGAEQGYAEAQHNLGIMYDKGEGVAQDQAEAVRWFRKAAEHGYLYSLIILSNLR